MSQEDNYIEELLTKQRNTYETIKSVYTNYKKDPVSRKTIEYLNKRIDTLQSYWDEFRVNDEILKQYELSDGDHDYYAKNIYEVTKGMFDETMQAMTKLRSELSGQQTPNQAATEPKPGPSGVKQTPRFDTTGVNLRTERTTEEPVNEDVADKKNLSVLLRKQTCNFNALERAISKVNLEEFNEQWQLQDQLTILQTKWQAVDKTHWELNFFLQGRDKNYEEQFNHWEKTYDDLKEDLNRKIFETSHYYDKTTPRIELPMFHGDYNNWVTFRDLFYETIHNNPTLNKTQKMKFLKSKLRDEAEQLIKHLSVSADNYDSCLDILQNRFDNKRKLFTSYVDTLLNQPSIEKPTAAALQKFYDTTNECLNALTNIGISIPSWGPLLTYSLLSKIDDVTHNEYLQNMKQARELPDLMEFMEFLESKFMKLESNRNKKSAQKPNYYNQTNIPHKTYNKPTNYSAHKYTKTFHAVIRSCPLCKHDHSLWQCPTFMEMDVATRYKTAIQMKLCKNCLFSHGENKCTSMKRCRMCRYKHHSLLHDEKFKTSRSTASVPQHTTNHVNGDQEILLTTLQLRVKNKEGDYVILRALLDQGSQVTLITENAAQRLNLPRNKRNAAVTGVGTIMGTSKGMITLECKSIHSDYTFQTEALIMRKLINNLPNTKVDSKQWSHLENIKLADPDFNIPGPVDLLLGADIYSEVILEGILKHNNNSPVAQMTKLGWILCGATKQFNCLVTLTELDNLSNFWEIEEIPTEEEPASDHESCEKHFQETTERLDSGRYVVKMPMKPNYEQNLGNSKPQAVAQFLNLERKMSRQEHFAKLYKQFIQDYIELGHMKPVTKTESQVQVYLPHHGVLRESSTTTKLRAVFNASMKTDSKYSLNDLMGKGPNLQKDILALIIKWRSYKYVLTADIEKMYRQILIHPEQQALQRIIWRSSTSEPLKEMQLCTLTYGTKAAPFIAMRVLQQLAEDEGDAFPLAKNALQNECYMDDVISGHHNIETTKQLQRELNELLKKGGFILRKWATNEPAILENLHETEKSQANNFNFKQQEFSKTLGLTWDDRSDAFHFIYEEPKTTKNATYTKRRLLSEISKIYDPLGWLAPMTIQAKLIFQKLWCEDYQHIGWDEIVPEKIAEEWIKIKSELHKLNNISLPRWIRADNKRQIELQAFSDASEMAYSCVIYCRTTSRIGEYQTTLLAAKTKVAPLKNKTSIPRLELCAAVLLAKLLDKIMKVLTDYDLKISCYTDSKVVLAWLVGNQTKYNKYVTNRTTQITSIVPAVNWGYVKSNENPADCATRGLLPSKLVTYTLWWEGPHWLKNQEKQPPNPGENFTTNEEIITNCFTINTTEPTKNKNELINSLIERYSNLETITRTLAWVTRAADAFRNKTKLSDCNKLNLIEINNALTMIIKVVQGEFFETEIKSIKQGGKLQKKSSILKLNPYLNNNGVLCVGGRLEHSNLPEETKHPILLPAMSRLTQLIIEKSHLSTLHGGARLTLAHTRNKYWIVNGNRSVKKVLRKCVQCRRYGTTQGAQLMGNLPKERITPSRAFLNTAVDFTGHVDIKINKGRGIKTCKGYIAIFICMSTKAVHIELVSDLSTQTFIAALKRMCARRGTPKHMYSDNGTNFVGAAKILNEEFQTYKTMLSSEFFKEINTLQIEWHFNAPSWPSAGGLWEAAVRSMKKHLKRVIGLQKLTFEQFSTLLTQIEACMNSRPLCPLSEDVEDLDYITPGHFLTGSPTLSLPLDEPAEMKSIDIRNHWKLIELMRRHYWDRWSTEYLHLLQNRTKWQQTKENIQMGQLVLVKENNLPPGKWAMGRVVELHPGTDKLVRVVTLKTQNGILKRPITKLAPLPINEKCESSKTQNSKPENDNRTEQKPTKKRKRKVNCLLMVLLAAFMTIPTGLATSTPSFKMTPLAENHPIYFDPVGKIQLIHDEWKLLVYYNLTTYWQSTSKVKEFVNHLSQVCATMPNEQCRSTISQLEFEVNQLHEYNQLLLSQHRQRRRRGYVNGVGNLARALFGVLDSDFAEKYARDIQIIKTNEQYLLQLIRNQTLIIEAENNIIKKNEEFVKTQLQIIQQYINETKDDMAMLENRFQIMKTMNDVNAGALTASLLLSVLRRNQQMLLDSLTDIYRGHLDMKLFTPEQLSDQLNNIAGIISEKLTLPIKINNGASIQNIYKLIYVKARLTEQYLLFELHIPLLSDDEYTLYRNVLIPKHVSANQCQVLAISTNYIGVNFAKSTYIQMEEADLQQCTTVTGDNHICYAYTPIRNLHGETASCEAKIMSQNVNITCDWIPQLCTNQWVKLQKSNIWLYNCVEECLTRIVCENQVTTTLIKKAGLLALGQNCVIQHKDQTLYSHNVLSSRADTGLQLEVPTIDAPNDIMGTYHKKNILLPRLNLSGEHRQIDYQIATQKAREHLPNNELSIHDIGNYSLSGVIVGGIIIAIIIWRVRYHHTFKRRCPPETKTEEIELREIPNPQPKPATRTSRQKVEFVL